MDVNSRLDEAKQITCPKCEEQVPLKRLCDYCGADLRPFVKEDLARMYNDAISVLIESLDGAIRGIGFADLRGTKKLCDSAGSFEASEYDTGQYAILRNKKQELETKIAAEEKKRLALQKARSIAAGSLLYWGVFAAVVFCAFTLKTAAGENGVLMMAAFAVFGGLAGFMFVFHFRPALGTAAGAKNAAARSAKFFAAVYGVSAALIMALTAVMSSGTVRGFGAVFGAILTTIIGAAAGTAGGAIIGAITGVIDRAIRRPAAGPAAGAVAGTIVSGTISVFLFEKLNSNTGHIVFLALFVYPLIRLYLILLKNKSFIAGIPDPKQRGSGRGIVPVVITAAVVILAAAGTVVWYFSRTLSPGNDPNGMVFIEGNTFTMGSPASEQGRENDEGPRHPVTLSSFYMGKKEVTAGEYRQFVRDSGYKTTAETRGGGRVVINDDWAEKADASWENPYLTQTDQHPVVLVSWYDAVEYCNWRSVQEGLTLAYSINGTTVTCNWSADGYRLPTEAEWEYACRAGTETPFSAGNNITTAQANYDGNSPYNGNAKGEYRQTTTTTGSFEPNPWGLYDMHGNVYEWCWDSYGDYSGGAQTNPVGPSAGSSCVVRGGSWYRSGRFLRSAGRFQYAASYRDNTLGFRLARSGSGE